MFKEIEYLVFKKNGQIVKYKIDSIEVENRLDEIIPDLLITCDGKKFIVEIFVTHAVIVSNLVRNFDSEKSHKSIMLR